MQRARYYLEAPSKGQPQLLIDKGKSRSRKKMSPTEQPDALTPDARVSATEPGPDPNRPFRGWRLLGVIFLVVVALAVVSAVVDWLVIGPLEGRAY